MAHIKTSVIIPVYNVKRYLQACIESVLNQTQKEMEIILVDDGSTDGSTEIVKDYEERYSIIKAAYQNNQKLGAARNRGITEAVGKYLCFLDADDYIAGTLFEECYRTAENEMLDYVMFDAVSFADGREKGIQEMAAKMSYDRKGIGIEDKVYSGTEYWKRYFSLGGIYSSACMVYVNADFLRRNSLYFERGVYYEDNDWILRMFLCAERVAYKPRCLYHRRCRAGSIMSVKYEDIHLRSIVAVSQKVWKMYMNETDKEKREMIIDMADILDARFGDIFSDYCRSGSLESILRETWQMYELILEACPLVDEKDRKLRLINLGIMVRDEMWKAGLVDGETGKSLEEEKGKVLFQEFQKFPLNRKGAVVGIYGTGQMCEKFLSLYRLYAKTICADIFFIDTYKESSSDYHGCLLYNLNDIAKTKADCIIIASTRYRELMLENLKARVSDEVEIFSLPDILQYF